MRACCTIANVLAHAPAMDKVVVISSETSTESDGELPASTGLIFTPTKRPPSPDLDSCRYIYICVVHHHNISQPLTVELLTPETSCESNSHST